MHLKTTIHTTWVWTRISTTSNCSIRWLWKWLVLDLSGGTSCTGCPYLCIIEKIIINIYQAFIISYYLASFMQTETKINIFPQYFLSKLIHIFPNTILCHRLHLVCKSWKIQHSHCNLHRVDHPFHSGQHNCLKSLWFIKSHTFCTVFNLILWYMCIYIYLQQYDHFFSWQHL